MKRSKTPPSRVNSKTAMLVCGVCIAALSMTQMFGQPRVNTNRLRLSARSALVVPFLGGLSFTMATIEFSQLVINQ